MMICSKCGEPTTKEQATFIPGGNYWRSGEYIGDYKMPDGVAYRPPQWLCPNCKPKEKEA